MSASDVSLSGLNILEDGRLAGTILLTQAFIPFEFQGRIFISTTADGVTEGDETLTVSVGETSASVVLADTSNYNTVRAYSVSVDGQNDHPIEGGLTSVVFSTSSVLVGTIVYFKISGEGITTNDFINFSLMGEFAVNPSGRFTLEIPVSADSFTEGDETFKIEIYTDSNRLSPVGNFANVTIRDTSKAVPKPSYTVTANQLTVNEGNTANFTLTTTGVADGTLVQFTLSGVSSDDILGGALSGSVTIQNGYALISISIATDKADEGIETITLTAANKSASINIVDTSIYKGPASSDLVYVFKSEKTGPAVNPASYSYYYTSNVDEVKYINAQANWPWIQKASTFEAAHSNPTLATPVFKFWSVKLQAPYFTISTAERDQIISWSSTGKNGYDWMYAGTGFSVYTSSAPTDALGKSAIPVYCVWMADTDFNPSNGLSGGLLFTADKIEYDGFVKLVGVTGAGVVFYGEVPGN